MYRYEPINFGSRKSLQETEQRFFRACYGQP